MRGGGTSCLEGCGIVHGLPVGLKPFVKTQPAQGEVGAVVKILGTNLTGATNGTVQVTVIPRQAAAHQ